jgi:SAM-dependent methyltransferase
MSERAARVHAEWEQAEILRSKVESERVPQANLRISDGVARRYANPPATTNYPLEYAFHLLGDVGGLRVLDFGCGTGANSALLARRGAHVLGVDISHDLLRIANERLRQNELHGAFVAASAHELPVEDNSCDIVFGIAILHHLDLAKVSHEVYRVLKPGGRAIFQEPVRNSRLITAARRMFPAKGDDISPYERPLTDSEVAAFADPFRSFSSRPFSLPHVRLAEHFGMRGKRKDILYRIDGALLRSRMPLRAYSAISVIELVK